jgi:hypothetical protein
MTQSPSESFFDKSDTPIWDADALPAQQLFDQQADYDCLLLQLWNNPYVRNSSPNSIDSLDSEIDPRLCHKPSCLLGSLPAPAEKESIMSSSLNTAHIMSGNAAPFLSATYTSDHSLNNSSKALAPEKAIAPEKALAPEQDDTASIRADINAMLKQQFSQRSSSQEELRLLHAKIRGLVHRLDRIEQQQTSTSQTAISHQMELRQLEQRLLRRLSEAVPQDRSFAAKQPRPADRFKAAFSTAIPEPRTQATTYIVPERARAVKADRALGSVPRFLMLAMTGVLLTVVVAASSPNPISLFTSLSDPILMVLRITFVVAAFSMAITAIWDTRR